MTFIRLQEIRITWPLQFYKLFWNNYVNFNYSLRRYQYLLEMVLLKKKTLVLRKNLDGRTINKEPKNRIHKEEKFRRVWDNKVPGWYRLLKFSMKFRRRMNKNNFSFWNDVRAIFRLIPEFFKIFRTIQNWYSVY